MYMPYKLSDGMSEAMSEWCVVSGIFFIVATGSLQPFGWSGRRGHMLGRMVSGSQGESHISKHSLARYMENTSFWRSMLFGVL